MQEDCNDNRLNMEQAVLLEQQQQQRQPQHHNMSLLSLSSSLIIVAKCPIIGKCKTRLIPSLGEIGATQLAKAMLSDILITISSCDELRTTDKILLYAPPTTEGETIMRNILLELQLNLSQWTLLPVDSSINNKKFESWSNIEQVPTTTDPTTTTKNTSYSCSSNYNMKSSCSSNYNMKSSNLGTILQNALLMARQRQREQIATLRTNTGTATTKDDANSSTVQDGYVIFIGMDSPELHLDEIIAVTRMTTTTRPSITSSVSSPSSSSSIPFQLPAILCPADDGGYGMIAVPPTADPVRTFGPVQWSTSVTAVSQIKALTDQFIPVLLGQCMYDIDTENDVTNLGHRLYAKQQQQQNDNSNHSITIGNETIVVENNNSDKQQDNVVCCLSQPSTLSELQMKGITSTDRKYTPSLKYTKQVLQDVIKLS